MRGTEINGMSYDEMDAFLSGLAGKMIFFDNSHKKADRARHKWVGRLNAFLLFENEEGSLNVELAIEGFPKRLKMVCPASGTNHRVIGELLPV